MKSKRSEVLFVDYIAEHLAPGGRAGVIVPEGVIFQSQNAYRRLREMLVEESLVAVVSLPAGVFNPYSGVKTSILLLDKSLGRRTKETPFSGSGTTASTRGRKGGRLRGATCRARKRKSPNTCGVCAPGNRWTASSRRSG